MDPVLEATLRPREPAALRPLAATVPTGLSAACLSALIDEVDVALLVCDGEARLLHANAAGWQELQWGDLLLQEPGARLSTSRPDQRQALYNALAAARSGRRQLMLLKGGSERVSLAVMPLPAAAGAEPRVMLLLGRRRVAPGLVVEMLCRMHAVTSAEQRVLNGLLDGLAAEEMARRFGVKLSTVRSQITALRHKLGVGRVTDAVRLAAGLPPMAGALRHQTRATKQHPSD